MVCVILASVRLSDGPCPTYLDANAAARIITLHFINQEAQLCTFCACTLVIVTVVVITSSFNLFVPRQCDSDGCLNSPQPGCSVFLFLPQYRKSCVLFHTLFPGVTAHLAYIYVSDLCSDKLYTLKESLSPFCSTCPNSCACLPCILCHFYLTSQIPAF